MKKRFQNSNSPSISVAIILILLLTSTTKIHNMEQARNQSSFLTLSSSGVPDEDVFIWEDIHFYDPIDPHCTMNSQAWQVIYNVYETLYTYPFNESNSQPDIPLLAAALPEVSVDGLNYTIALRQGITFHDGTPFNASCVKWNFERGMKIFSPDGMVWTYAELLKGGRNVSEIAYDNWGSPEFQDAFDDWVANSGAIEVIDLYTIRFVLEDPYTGFTAVLGAPGTSIMSPTYAIQHASDPAWANWESYGVDYCESIGWMQTHACGTGPYSLTTFLLDDLVELQLWDSYWRSEELESGLAPPSYAGSINHVIIEINNDGNSRRMNLNDGIIDGGYMPTSYAGDYYDQEMELSLVPGVYVSAGGYSLSQVNLGFNMNGIQTDAGVVVSPFDETHFRRAVSWAFDYDTLIEEAANGYAIQNRGPIPFASYGHNGSAFTYSFNITKAVEEWNLAMDNASFVDALNVLEGSINLVYNSGNFQREIICNIIADGLEQMYTSPQANHTGLLYPLTVEIDELEWYNYLNYYRQDRLPVFFLGWVNEYDDPDNPLCSFVFENGTFANRVSYSNPIMNDLYLLQRNETNPLQRQIYLDQIQALVAEDCPYVWLYQSTEFRVWRTWLQGIGLTYKPLYANGGLYFYHLHKPSLSDIDEPVIDSPPDLEIEYESTGHNIIWNPTDPYPDSYRLYIDGVTEEGGNWNGSSISIEIEGLEPGVYEYTLLVFDLALNSAYDSVMVTVIDPSVTTTTTTTTSTSTTTHTYTLGGIPLSDIIVTVLMLGMGSLGAVIVLVILFKTKPA